MLDQALISLGLLASKIPGFPVIALNLFRGLENSDTYGIFQGLVWIPFNVYVFIRLFQSSLNIKGDLHSAVYALSSFMVCFFWAYYNFSLNTVDPARFAVEFRHDFITVKLLTTYVQCFLLVKISWQLFLLLRKVLQMHGEVSVIQFIFKESNLKMILSVKTLMRFLIAYMILEVLNEFIGPHEDVLINTLFVWGMLTVPVLIICFALAKHSLSKRHQSLFMEVFEDADPNSNASIEEVLNAVASKRMATQLIVNEIFMDQIIKLALMTTITYLLNYLLK
jgi:hypothetical protein